MIKYFRFLWMFLMVFSFAIGYMNISYYLGSSTAYVTQFFIFLSWLFLFWISYTLKRKNADRADHVGTGIRIIYIPVVGILGLLVYANYSPSLNLKPSNIEESCTMNGLWEWDCTFTNLWEKEGSSCWYIALYKKEDSKEIGQSSSICSGKLEGRSTAKQSFTIVETRTLCAATNGSAWSDACEFSFVPKN